ncbi:MAG: PilZ domain-containing protein [PVC group bacterium]|nr:PilZ domain-containing protein [PVC group bacterium]
MMKNNHEERRSHPRFISTLPLEISTPDFNFQTRTTNLSCSGILCEIDRFIPVQTKLNVTMRLSLVVDDHKIKKSVSCPAIVSRIDPAEQKDIGNYNVGIVFLHIEGKDKEFILQFIRQKNLKEAKELKRLYLQLKEMAGRLVELEECHPTAEHFRKVISGAIMELDAAAHILDYEINELKNLE